MSTKQERDYESKKSYKKSFDALTLKQQIKILDKIQKKPVGYLKSKKSSKSKSMFGFPSFRF